MEIAVLRRDSMRLLGGAAARQSTGRNPAIAKVRHCPRGVGVLSCRAGIVRDGERANHELPCLDRCHLRSREIRAYACTPSVDSARASGDRLVLQGELMPTGNHDDMVRFIVALGRLLHVVVDR